MEASLCENTDYVLHKIKWQIEHNDGKLADADLAIFTDSVSKDDIVDVLFDTIKHRRPDILARILPSVNCELKHTLRCGKSVLDKLLCVSVENGQLELVKVLVNAGADPSEEFYGKPLLHLAAMGGCVEIAGELMSAGARVDSTDKRGDTALHNVLASQSPDNLSMCKWLLKNGVCTRRYSSSGKHPLHLASTSAPEVLDLLLSRGHDVNTPDTINGDTPLHVACNMANSETITVLIKHGCKFNQVNKHRQTPLAKLLRLAKDFNDFHSRSRLKLGEQLYKMGFRMYCPLSPNISLTKWQKSSSRQGRDKVYDKYLEMVLGVAATPSLQSTCRVAVRASLASGVGFKKQVTSLHIPTHLKHYLEFDELDTSLKLGST
ncbi:ANR52-like protein [Mya arenaria]|uniref:ANR52-like protein n=1 Tax=Mya arenaria TaxID=6604 RepID=A0ABY7DJI2_MYAAR|nr:ankyrin repeat and SOCS box protein 8-like [Mya arenaria]WAQ96771.1 ANR52-like protein [Mya arenaria]